MNKIIVTGGSGFIGQNFIRSTIDKYKILNLDCLAKSSDKLANFNIKNKFFFKKINICNRDKLKSILFDFEPDMIINFAAHTHVDKSIKDSSIFLENILGTHNLLSIATLLNKKKKIKFLQISTDEVFGSVEGKKFDKYSPYKPNSPYSASKAAGDHLVRAFHKTYGLSTLITYSCNNFGPFQFLEKLIPLTIFKFLKGEKIGLYGNGMQKRQWIYVDDNVRAISKVIGKKFDNSRYFIGSKYEITNLQLVKILLESLNKKTIKNKNFNFRDCIEFIKDRPGHDFHYSIDYKSFENNLNWKQLFSLKSGIDLTIDWYLQNKKWVKKQSKYLEYFKF